MTNIPNGSPWSGQAVSDLLTQASAVLSREMARGSGGVQTQGPSTATPAMRAVDSVTGMAGRTCPVTGAALPLSPPDIGRLPQQAHELVETLLATLGQGSGEKSGAYGAAPYEDRVPLLQCIAPVYPGGGPTATEKVAIHEGTPPQLT